MCVSILCSVHGNPNLNHPKANQKAMIIVLAVGIPLGVIPIVVVLVYFLSRRKQKPDQAQSIESEIVRPQVEGSAQVNPQECVDKHEHRANAGVITAR